jgi:hypothetical protein
MGWANIVSQYDLFAGRFHSRWTIKMSPLFC